MYPSRGGIPPPSSSVHSYASGVDSWRQQQYLAHQQQLQLQQIQQHQQQQQFNLLSYTHQPPLAAVPPPVAGASYPSMPPSSLLPQQPLAQQPALHHPPATARATAPTNAPPATHAQHYNPHTYATGASPRQFPPSSLPLSAPLQPRNPIPVPSATAGSSSTAAASPSTAPSAASGMKTADFLRQKIKMAEDSIRKMHTNGPGSASNTPHKPIVGAVSPLTGTPYQQTTQQTIAPTPSSPVDVTQPASAADQSTSAPAHLSTQQNLSPRQAHPLAAKLSQQLSQHAAEKERRLQQLAQQLPVTSHQQVPITTTTRSQTEEPLTLSTPSSTSSSFSLNSSTLSPDSPNVAESVEDAETAALLAEVEASRLRREAAEKELAIAEEQARRERQEMQFRQERLERDTAALAALDAKQRQHQQQQQQQQQQASPDSSESESLSLSTGSLSLDSTSASLSAPDEFAANTDEIALIMRVSMDHGQVDLAVPRNADPVDLAIQFCKEQGLEEDKVESLALSIEQHLDMLFQQEKEQSLIDEENKRVEREQQARLQAEADEEQKIAEEEAARREEEDRILAEKTAALQAESDRRKKEFEQEGEEEAEEEEAQQEEEEAREDRLANESVGGDEAASTSRTSSTKTHAKFREATQEEESKSTSDTNRQGRSAHREPKASVAGGASSRSRSASTRKKASGSAPHTPRRMDPKLYEHMPNINRHSIELLNRSARKAARSRSSSRAGSRERKVSAISTSHNDNTAPSTARKSARSAAASPSPAYYHDGQSYASIVASTPFHERLHAEATSRKAHLVALQEAKEEEWLVLQASKKVLRKSRQLASVRVTDARPIGDRLYSDGLKQMESQKKAHEAKLKENAHAIETSADEFTFHPEISEFAQSIQREGEHNYERIVDYNGSDLAARRQKRAEAIEKKLKAQLADPASFKPELNEKSQELAARRAARESAERREHMEQLRNMQETSEEAKSADTGTGTPATHDRLHDDGAKATQRRADLIASHHEAEAAGRKPLRSALRRATPSHLENPYPICGPFELPRRVELIYWESTERGRRAHIPSMLGLQLLPPTGAWSVQADGSAKWVPTEAAEADEKSAIAAAPITLSTKRFQRAKDIFSVLDINRAGMIDSSCMSRVASLHPADQNAIFGLLRRLGDAQRMERVKAKAEESGLTLERALAALNAYEARNGTPPPIFILLFSDFLHLFRFELALLAREKAIYDILEPEAGDKSELTLPAYVPGSHTASRAHSRRGSFMALEQARARSRSASRNRASSRGPSVERLSQSRGPSVERANARAIVPDFTQTLAGFPMSAANSQALPHQLQQQLAHSPESNPALAAAAAAASGSQHEYLQAYRALQQEIDARFAHESPEERAERHRLAYESQLAVNEQKRHEDWLKHQQWLHESSAAFEEQIRQRHEATMALEAARLERARAEAEKRPPAADRASHQRAYMYSLPPTHAQTQQQRSGHASVDAVPGSEAASAAVDSGATVSLMALAQMDLTGGSTTGSSFSSTQELPSGLTPVTNAGAALHQEISVEELAALAAAEAEMISTSSGGRSRATSTTSQSAAAQQQHQTPSSSAAAVATPRRTSASPAPSSTSSSAAVSLLPTTQRTPRRHHYGVEPTYKPEISPHSKKLAEQSRKKVQGQAIHDILYRQAVEQRQLREYTRQARHIGEQASFDQQFAQSPYKK